MDTFASMARCFRALESAASGKYTIQEKGSWEELSSKSTSFKDFIQTYSKSKETTKMLNSDSQKRDPLTYSGAECEKVVSRPI